MCCILLKMCFTWNINFFQLFFDFSERIRYTKINEQKNNGSLLGRQSDAVPLKLQCGRLQSSRFTRLSTTIITGTNMIDKPFAVCKGRFWCENHTFSYQNHTDGGNVVTGITRKNNYRQTLTRPPAAQQVGVMLEAWKGFESAVYLPTACSI